MRRTPRVWARFCAPFAPLEAETGVRGALPAARNWLLTWGNVLWGYLESNQGPLLYQCGARGAHDLQLFAFPQVESRFQLSSLPVTCHRFAFVSGLNVACPCWRGASELCGTDLCSLGKDGCRPRRRGGALPGHDADPLLVREVRNSDKMCLRGPNWPVSRQVVAAQFAVGWHGCAAFHGL